MKMVGTLLGVMCVCCSFAAAGEKVEIYGLDFLDHGLYAAAIEKTIPAAHTATGERHIITTT